MIMLFQYYLLEDKNILISLFTWNYFMNLSNYKNIIHFKEDSSFGENVFKTIDEERIIVRGNKNGT